MVAPPSPDAPIAVLSDGVGGLCVAAALGRLMPREDLVLLADNAYAPYARRQPRVVVDRVARMVDELVTHRPKLIVLASAQATADALDVVRTRSPVAVVPWDGLLSMATARSRGGMVAVVSGAGCRRGLQQAKGLRRERGAGRAAAIAWVGLRELVEAGRSDSNQAHALVASELVSLRDGGADVVLLACPHSSAVRPLVHALAPGELVVVDGAQLVADRAAKLMRRAGLLARRKRAGRRVVIASDPAAAQRGLAAGGTMSPSAASG